MKEFKNSEIFAKELDNSDPLHEFRSQFYFPSNDPENAVYFVGNSLGLQPRSVEKYIQDELKDWRFYGVEGHFMAKKPWVSYHEMFAEPLAKIVGALPHEVVCMNSLTANLHFLLASFYQPKGKRTKILCESKSFPSDAYALASQVKWHGLNPNEHLLEVAPKEGELVIYEDDICAVIEQHNEEIACILLGGVNYYTGQVFDMQKITAKAKEYNITVGFDLAHGVGNIELDLHNWDVDFAMWCSYKYLNSGPGGVAGAYIHEKHATNKEINRLAGWWGQNKETRFQMSNDFDPIPTAESWQVSNAPVLSMAAHKASLDLFAQTSMADLRKKSLHLTSYLEFVIQNVASRYDNLSIEIITPNHFKRGCQLSLYCHGQGKELFTYLQENNVYLDWREPNVIRLAPVPMYNSFTDVFKFGQRLEGFLAKDNG